MIYDDHVAYIGSLEKFALGSLENLVDFLDFIGNPQDDLKTIHIGGTNGKGSTIAYLTSLLASQGFKVGALVSPSLYRINERFLINSQPIGDEDFVRLSSQLRESIESFKKAGGRDLVNYDYLTCLGFLYFKERGCDYSLIEVGLGGRFDSTNVINPLVSVISSIGLDHQEILGDTLEDIAWQKAGIIKAHTPLVTISHSQAIDQVLIKEAQIKSAPYFILDRDLVEIKKRGPKSISYRLRLKDLVFDYIVLSSPATYQAYNSALALATFLKIADLDGIEFEKESIYRSLKKAYWPARMEELATSPRSFVDGAHNEEALRVLFETLSHMTYRKLIVVFATMADKDIGPMARLVEEAGDIVICTSLDNPRAIGAEELKKYFENNVFVEDSLKKAFKRAMDIGQEDDLIVFCGSLYLAKELREIIDD